MTNSFVNMFLSWIVAAVVVQLLGRGLTGFFDI